MPNAKMLNGASPLKLNQGTSVRYPKKKYLSTFNNQYFNLN
jgi:hypothetical protein